MLLVELALDVEVVALALLPVLEVVVCTPVVLVSGVELELVVDVEDPPEEKAR